MTESATGPAIPSQAPPPLEPAPGEKKDNTKTILIIVGVVVLVLILCCCAAFGIPAVLSMLEGA